MKNGTSGSVLMLDLFFVLSAATITFLPSMRQVVTVWRKYLVGEVVLVVARDSAEQRRPLIVAVCHVIQCLMRELGDAG